MFVMISHTSVVSFIVNFFCVVIFSQLELLIASHYLLAFGLEFLLCLWLYPLIFLLGYKELF